MVQWLRLCTFTAGGTGSIPGQGTKILHATWCKGKEKTKKNWNIGTKLTGQTKGRVNLGVCLIILATFLCLALSTQNARGEKI